MAHGNTFCGDSNTLQGDYNIHLPKGNILHGKSNNHLLYNNIVHSDIDVDSNENIHSWQQKQPP